MGINHGNLFNELLALVWGRCRILQDEVSGAGVGVGDGDRDGTAGREGWSGHDGTGESGGGSGHQ